MTGEAVPVFFRMSAFAPVNIPLAYFMITAKTLPVTLFLQWANQSYNTGTNYFNRSGADMTNSQILEAYGMAVGVSCSIAYAMTQLVKKGPPIFKRLGLLVPFLSVASAGCANIIFTRRSEATNGVPVTNNEGKVLGISKIAGFNGVLQTALSRGAFVPIPVLLAPPIIFWGLKRIGWLPSNPRLKVACELGVVYLCLQIGLPVAIALFPAKSEYKVTDLEPEFHHLEGEGTKTVFANKGL